MPLFQSKRFVNWFLIGSLYGTFYFGRYNLSIISPYLKSDLNLSHADIGILVTFFHWSYALGLLINGFLADRFGGKSALQIAALGTMITNLFFGSMIGHKSFWWLTAVWAANGYFQSFGAPGMVKINAAWFELEERGKFTAVFGLLIRGGHLLANWSIPILLSGFTFFGWQSPPIPYKGVFFVAPCLVGVFLIASSLIVAESPEKNARVGPVTERTTIPFSMIATPVLLVAGAYLCTGLARSTLEHWYPLYLQESYKITPTSAEFKSLASFLVIAAASGPFVSGFVSDMFAHSNRGSVAALSYGLVLVASILGHLSNSFPFFFVLALILSFAINAPHSLLGGAAPMDIGRVKRTGYATGVIDAFQYIGGGLSALLTGYLIDYFSWSAWWSVMLAGGLLGATLALLFRKHEKRESRLNFQATDPVAQEGIDLPIPLTAKK